MQRATKHKLIRFAAIRLILCGLLTSFFTGELRAEEQPGKAIFLKKCASCHGNEGTGTEDNYPQPLVGDLSINQLADYITETMPSENPEECVGEEAKQVAAYIHEAFYSITAQFRNKPPRIELARLTNRQYATSVSDLVYSFDWDRGWDDQRGLKAEYFKSRRTNKQNRIVERTDPVVDFNFGELLPEQTPEQAAEEAKKEAEENKDEKEKNKKPKFPEYAINWSGALLATESGDYEIIVETENSFQLWVNDHQEAFIDAKVRSGDQTVYKKSIKLLGGRYYPIRLNYISAESEKTGSVRLKWKPPAQVEEVIPARNLSPNHYRATMIVETPFPPDDRSVGYERGISVSPEWDAATTQAALEVAGKIIPQLNELAKLKGDPKDHRQKLQDFCIEFTSRAFRRPLSEEQKQFFVLRHFDEADSLNGAVKRVVLLSLKSPRFLFPGVGDPEFDQYRTASWLALSLWDSLPDEQLRKAAERGELKTREQIASQAERMIRDPRTRAKTQDFFHHWLDFERFYELSKAQELYADFNEQIASDLRTSLALFIDDVVWSESSDYRQLLQAEYLFLNGRLANYYGAEVPAETEEFQKVSLEPQARAGILTHPYLMAGFAYDDVSSPIHRGVFLTRNVLGRFLKPPPIAVAPTPVELAPDLTTRERVTLQTRESLCMNCHGTINQLGFTLEHFDAVGRYRETDGTKQVDASGAYIKRTGEEVRFNGARELALFLTGSEEAHSAFVEHLFKHLIKQPAQAFGPEMLDLLTTRFAEDNFHIRHLMREIVTETVLSAREQENSPVTAKQE